MNLKKNIKEKCGEHIVSLLLLTSYSAYYFFTRNYMANLKDPLVSELKLTATEFGRISGAFTMTYSIFQVFGGYCLDRFSLGRLISLSLLGIFTCQVIFFNSSSFLTLEISRYFLGIFFSIAVTSRLKYLSSFWSENFVILNGGISTIMAFIGVFAASNKFKTYLEIFGWRKVFNLYAFISIPLAVFSLIFLKNKKEKVKENNLEKVSFKKNLSFFIRKKEVIPFVLYTIVISCGTYLLVDGHGNSLMRLSLTGLKESYYNYPGILNMIGNGTGTIYNMFAGSRFSYKTQMKIQGTLNLIGVIGLVFFNKNIFIFLFSCFLIGFSYVGQGIGFLWLKNHMPIKYQGLSFGFLNFMGVFFGGAMTERLGGVVLDRCLLKQTKLTGAPSYSYENFVFLFKLLLIPGILTLIISFFCKKNEDYFYENK